MTTPDKCPECSELEHRVAQLEGALAEINRRHLDAIQVFKQRLEKSEKILDHHLSGGRRK